MKTGSKIIISVIVVIALIAGGFTYLNYSNSNTGKVSVYVEDAPILNVSAVYITFANFSLHNTSSGRIIRLLNYTFQRPHDTSKRFLVSVDLRAIHSVFQRGET